MTPPTPARGATTLRVQWEGRRSWPVLVWSAPGPPPGLPGPPGLPAGLPGLSAPWRCISTGLVGGGIGPIGWWVDAMVPREYFHHDPVAHVRQIAGGLGLTGPGVGMLTAADVTMRRHGHADGVEVVATVGLGLPVWAAASEEEIAAEADVRVGTINLLAVVPVPMSDAALVNAVVTATEAKSQALVEAGVPGTGTSSDAVCIACPAHVPEADPGLPEPQEYGGPRSPWGQRLARAVHAAVSSGTAGWAAASGRRGWAPTTGLIGGRPAAGGQAAMRLRGIY